MRPFPWAAIHSLAGVLPQTYAGVGAGCLTNSSSPSGYYITPALLGSPNDQMVSYFVAFYTNTSISWGMAARRAAVAGDHHCFI